MQKITIAFLLLFLQMICFANDTTTIKRTEKENELVNAGLVLPKGFSAIAITDSVGKARHIKITKKGVLYIKLSKLVNGKGILRAEDKNADGKIDDI